VNQSLLGELLADPYITRKWPKSAGREQYGAEFVARMKRSRLPLRHLIATATALTTATISLGIAFSAGVGPWDVIVSGGGVHNPQLMTLLARELPGIPISTTADHGIDVNAKEAIAFAILAQETWRRNPSNLPSATGARNAAVLGSITP